MKMEHLLDLPVGRLQYVFDPPGLPVVAKSENSLGTTSILVRGTAGSGKSTLAAAFALTLAKRAGGVVLYLSTETAPTDVAYKAQLLGLGEVYPITQRNDAGVGAVIAHHLAMAREEVRERRSEALDVVWQEVEKPTVVPIRAVVIDAFGQPFSDQDAGLREQTAALVHSLEQLGISVVFIEEGVETVWLSYVVDIVFRLDFEEGAHRNGRSLHVSKCRYAQSVPGPHRYTLRDGLLEVWPDLLAVQHFIPLEQLTEQTIANISGLLIKSGRMVLFGPSGDTAVKSVTGVGTFKIVTIGWGPQIAFMASDDLAFFIEATDLMELGWSVYELALKNDMTLFVLSGAPIHETRVDSTNGLSRFMMAMSILGISFWVMDPDRHTPFWLRNLASAYID